MHSAQAERLCCLEKAITESPLRVKVGRTQSEQMSSGLPPESGHRARYSWHVANVPTTDNLSSLLYLPTSPLGMQWTGPSSTRGHGHGQRSIRIRRQHTAALRPKLGTAAVHGLCRGSRPSHCHAEPAPGVGDRGTPESRHSELGLYRCSNSGGSYLPVVASGCGDRAAWIEYRRLLTRSSHLSSAARAFAILNARKA